MGKTLNQWSPSSPPSRAVKGADFPVVDWRGVGSNPTGDTFSFWIFCSAAVAEWLSSWLAEQEDRGSIPRLATWIFSEWVSVLVV